MATAFLTLSIGSLSVTLTRFLSSTNLLRTQISGTEAEVTYTASGNAIYTGRRFEPLQLWTVDAYLPTADYRTLKLIWAESDYQRRTLGSPEVLIQDRTQLFEERTARTRAIVAGTSEITQGSYKLYYAQFKGIFQRQPDFRLFGKDFAATFVLQETSKVAA